MGGFVLGLVGLSILLLTAKSSILSTLDVGVFLLYFVAVAGYGLWIFLRERQQRAGRGEEGTSAGFFLAEGSLSWWAIGASIIASNISAEHFIGMSGNGFLLGLAISCYEWLSVYAIILGAVFFMPVYLKYHIFTMPQFLAQRFSPVVSTCMALVWLLLYVLINLTSILYLGALAVSSVTNYPFSFCMVFLGLSACLVAVGGMRVIGYTDFVQVAVLLFGGLATTYTAVVLVSQRFQAEDPGFVSGMRLMMERSPDHFHLILNRDNPSYAQLPGVSILFALNIGNIYYWACNQYIVQRALGADLSTARNGMLFASFLKILVPLIVVLPGIACYTLWSDGMFHEQMLSPDPATGDPVLNQDRAYPVLLSLLPSGLKGLAFAALSAAIISSLASKANSIATIFTLDIFLRLRPDSSERLQILVGRAVVFLTILLAIIISPYLGIDKTGGYQFVQQMTGFLTPGILVTFLAGLFWKRGTVSGALVSLIGGLLMSVVLAFLVPAVFDLSPLIPYGFAVRHPDGSFEIPFLDMMLIVFFFCALAMILCGFLDPSAVDNPLALQIDSSMFLTSRPFAIISIVLISIVVLLYIFLW